MNTLADKIACQWTGIEYAMKFANSHPAFRPGVESLVDRMHNWISDAVLAFVAVADLWIAFMYAMNHQVRCEECGESLRKEKTKWP